MNISRTRLNALIALGKREAEIGQTPGTGTSDQYLIFLGKYNQQLEWAAQEGLCHRGMCVFERKMSTLTADGMHMLKPAFNLTPDGVSVAVHGEIGKKVSAAARDRTFGKTKKQAAKSA